MKHVIHSATGQYEFLETEFEANPNDDKCESQVRTHNDILKLIKGEPAGVGLPPTEWRNLIDSYLNNKPYDYESVIERLSAEQRFCCNSIKLSRIRTKKKEPEVEDEGGHGMDGNYPND